MLLQFSKNNLLTKVDKHFMLYQLKLQYYQKFLFYQKQKLINLYKEEELQTN